MKLKIHNLEKCFKNAIENNSKYIAVKIKTRNSIGEEIIINPKSNFEAKLNYYKNAYNENLVLKSFDGIQIVGFTYGNSLEDIEKDLIG